MSKNKKFLIVMAVIVLIVIITPTKLSLAEADADPGIGFFKCATNPATCAIYYLTVVVNAIMQLLISLGAWMVQLSLEFNQGILRAPTVTTGFNVTLSIANLGFVLALIIIALATILRRESYGVKSLLWKLVLAAVLVNFSLVIAGQVLALSDSFTKYFIDPFGGTGGFTSKLAGSFGVQKPLLSNVKNAPSAKEIGVKVGCGAAAGTTGFWEPFTRRVCEYFLSGSSIDDFFKVILNLVFVIVLNFIVMFTLFVLAILLLVRYVTISILLILSPLAWLAWVFPGLGNHFSKWWHDFIKWAFFPAITTFFLWLVVVIANNQDYITNTVGGSVKDPNLTPAAALGIATENVGLLATAGQQIVLVALAIGGLFAANQMSIKGADVAMKGLKGVGNATKGYLGKQAGKAKSYGLRTEMGRKVTGGLQTAGMGPNTHPVIRALLRPAREAGTFLAKRRESTEGLVKKKQSELGKYSYEEQAKRFGSEDNPGRLAIMENLKRAEKKGDLNAKAAFDSLPQNAKDRLDRLRTLYGRGKGEHFESGAGAATAVDKMEEEVKKREEEGEKVDDIKEPLEDLKAAEKKKKEAEDKQNKGDDSEKTISAIKDEGEKSRRALESIKEAVQKRKNEGKDVEVFQNAIDEFELAQRETEGKKEKGGEKRGEAGPVIKIFGENIGEGPIETMTFDDQGKPKA